MNEIIQHFSEYIAISDDLKDAINSRTTSQTFKKGTVIHNAGEVCVESHFIQKGILRLYYLKNGKEISEYFCGKDEWVNSPRSFIFRQPDHYYIDVLEDAEVFTLNIDDLGFLFDHFPEMERYARLSMGTMFYQLIERITSMGFTNAKQKYDHFCLTYKAILPRIPLGMIASYLGITQETLSRVRAKR